MIKNLYLNIENFFYFLKLRNFKVIRNGSHNNDVKVIYLKIKIFLEKLIQPTERSY